jgi:hypothetical protein
MPDEPDDVKAVAGFGNGESAGVHALQRGLEFGHGLTVGQLAEAAAVLGRRLAVGMAARKFRE